MNNKALAVVFSILLVGFLAALSGCKDDSSKSEGKAEAPRIGVVNLDNVVKELGWVGDLDDRIAAVQSDQKAQLQDQFAKLNSMIAEKAKQYGVKEGDRLDKLPEVPRQELQQMLNARTNFVNQLQQIQQQQLNVYKAEWYAHFREALTPIVRDVAQEKKISLVLLEANTILYTDPTIDVTSAVSSAARAKRPQVRDVTKPELKIQGTGVLPATQPTTMPTTAPTTAP